jgi:Endonuclease NucS
MVSSTFKIEDAYRFAAAHGLEAEASAIREMKVHSAIPKPVTVRKGRLIELFESRGFMDAFVAASWPGRHTAAGEIRRTLLLNKKNLHERLLRGESPDEDTDAPEVINFDMATETPGFSLEAQLRDFIAQNLSRIPINGRSVRLFIDQAGRGGVEYPTGVGPVDILATDEARNFVVFELKLERGPDRALGQLARYMGWIKANLAGEHQVFGVVVAKSIDDRLRYAVQVIPNVTLLEYEIDFRLRDASTITRLSP